MSGTVKNNERSVRSVVKAATWRIIATCDTIFLSWIFTGQISAALKIGATEVLTKIGLFYLHERIWFRLNFGKIYGVDRKTIVGEKHYRSLVKGISWRFFGTLDTIIIALFWTGDFTKAFAIGGTEIITKVGLFWVHERVWLRIKWGKNPSVPSIQTWEDTVAEAPVVILDHSGENTALTARS